MLWGSRNLQLLPNFTTYSANWPSALGSYTPLPAGISGQLSNFTTQHAALWFSGSQLPNFTTQHTAPWFSGSQLASFTTHSILPFGFQYLRMVAQFHYTHTAYCPIALWFSEYHDSCPILPHTQHTAAWFSESQDINWFLPISPQIQHCPSDFRLSGCKPAVASFTTDSTLPFWFQNLGM